MNSIEHFVEIGIALSSEKNHHVLLEKILKSAMQLASADAGTIYSVSSENKLVFETLLNNSLNSHLGGTTGKAIEYPNIPVFQFGEINKNAMVAVAAASGEIINIKDAYTNTDYNFCAAKEMDKLTGYKTQSVLTLPMKNHQEELNGVIQLINASDGNGNVIPFSDDIQRTTHALTSLAAIIITNKQLINEMEHLFSSFSKLIASAIDKKSPYTGEHCRRVPVITMMLAKACHKTTSGPLNEFHMDKEDFHELNVAAWLHDCGKIATPEYVMDKPTKLSTVFDRIEIIEARFEIASRDIYNSKKLDDQNKAVLLKQLDIDRDFIRKANTGGEFFDNNKINHIYSIAKQYQISIAGVKQSVISDDEVYNLIIKRGTINPKERKIINGHMDVTVEMLESMPFPKHLQRVPEFACGHHEKMDGTGYPKGLTREQMSIPARMMAIADVFEALTANDRPYKPPKTLSETLTIMGVMKLDNHLDPDLFDVFINKKVYIEFAKKYLLPTQIDQFDINDIPGCGEF
ncbi:HD family phosphohydrolase [Pseudoalteromonas denitrificans]|uniref:HD-GYP domain, c-di-GMP phosphodiesterase class II (Or its inactivated variant) n=1 Tax=Pseudoalteromonas denitrificans DSM 6059 TaxID=1123010 RepID=A0A1I1ESM3_9GAMM|nr:HD family phosphohydrolase [Pseudoalteromonas denitrificans]SFB89702.1 HD-GYP domain, c-di-GMP phosphodiesterase class II (or its inactivated variant) [Pseudoalteromonas denitrificans DSM 6059]